MSAADREKWNDRYLRGEGEFETPHPFLKEIAHLLPPPGKALEIAGGRGRNALWLAQLGWDVTIADISEFGLQLARDEAARRGLSIDTLAVDFDDDALPTGPFDLVICTYFVHRPLFPQILNVLKSGGAFAYVHATRTNLTRNEKPPEGYLLEDGELPSLVTGLRIVSYFEGWTDEGRHEARLLAVRS